MDTLQLRLFASVAHTCNFSRTAELFFMSQPAVTHHIKMLESTLGVTLFNRTSRSVTLSEEGLEFLQYVNQALEIISDGENRVHNMAQGRTGHIRIAALSSVSEQLRACLATLYKNYPTIQVDIDVLEGSELIAAVQKESYDFYFSIGDMLTGAKIEALPISEDRLELFVNTSHLEQLSLSDWSTIQRHPFISIRRSDAWLTGRIRLICKNRGVVPNIINYYNRADAVLLSVDAGIGIAILPGELKRYYQHPNVVALPIDGEDARVTYAIAWNTATKNTACAIFRDIIIEAKAVIDNHSNTTE